MVFLSNFSGQLNTNGSHTVTPFFPMKSFWHFCVPNLTNVLNSVNKNMLKIIFTEKNKRIFRKEHDYDKREF